MTEDRAYFTNTRGEMHRFLPPHPRRILEIGCGEGRFAMAIEGVEERWGVEPDPTSAAIAARHLTRVLPGLYETERDALPDAYFDVVICNDVIEHMTDHDAFFRDISRKLAPGGAIVGSLPNVRYFKNLFDLVILRDWDYKDAGVLDRTHFRFFTQKSLRRSLEAAGYQVQALSGLNQKLTEIRGPRDLLYTLFGLVLIVCSLGSARDTAYMQIAFRASPE